MRAVKPKTPVLAKPLPSCGSCSFWTAPRDVVARGGVTLHGRCRRYPEEWPKDAADLCGEYARKT